MVSDWEYLLQSYKRVTGIDLKMKRIAGQIAWFNCHTTVLTAKSIPNSLYLMKRQSEKIVDDKPLLYKFNKKSQNYAENRLNCIHGVSSELAELITHTLNLQSEKDLMSLTVDDLRRVNNIGYKKAENILYSLHGA
jgi:ERCC4-type nuclease